MLSPRCVSKPIGSIYICDRRNAYRFGWICVDFGEKPCDSEVWDFCSHFVLKKSGSASLAPWQGQWSSWHPLWSKRLQAAGAETSRGKPEEGPTRKAFPFDPLPMLFCGIYIGRLLFSLLKEVSLIAT